MCRLREGKCLPWGDHEGVKGRDRARAGWCKAVRTATWPALAPHWLLSTAQIPEHHPRTTLHQVIVPLDDSPSGAQQSAQAQQQQQQPPGERSELKDRFLTQLESVVMDWALQHHPAAVHGTTHGPAAAGGGMLTSFGSGPGAIALSGGGGGGITQAMASQANVPLGPQPLARTTSLNASLYQQQQQQGSGYGGTCTPGQGAAPGQVGSATLAAALEAQLGAKGLGRGQAAGASSAGGGGGSGHGRGAHGGGGSEAGAGSQTGYDPEYQPFEMLVLEAALAEVRA